MSFRSFDVEQAAEAEFLINELLQSHWDLYCNYSQAAGFLGATLAEALSDMPADKRRQVIRAIQRRNQDLKNAKLTLMIKYPRVDQRLKTLKEQI